jgi:hypothetical protein
LSIAPRRILLRWTSTASQLTILILTVSTLLIEVFFTDYLVARGLEYKTYQLTQYLTIPYPYIPLVGFLAVILFSWTYLVKVRSFVLARPGASLPKIILPIRMFEIAFVLLTVLACSLFMPYILGSNWMMHNFFNAKSSIPSLSGLYSSYYGAAPAMMMLAPLWKYFLSNMLSYIIVVVAALIMARKTARRARPR